MILEPILRGRVLVPTVIRAIVHPLLIGQALAIPLTRRAMKTLWPGPNAVGIWQRDVVNPSLVAALVQGSEFADRSNFERVAWKKRPYGKLRRNWLRGNSCMCAIGRNWVA